MPASSSARRLFPIPGSPPTRIRRPRPATALSSPSSSVPNSRCRPTKTAPACSSIVHAVPLLLRSKHIDPPTAGNARDSFHRPFLPTVRACGRTSRLPGRCPDEIGPPGARASREHRTGRPIMAQVQQGTASNAPSSKLAVVAAWHRSRGGGARHRSGHRREHALATSDRLHRVTRSPRRRPSSSGQPSAPSRRGAGDPFLTPGAIEFRAGERGYVAAAVSSDPLLTQQAIDFRADERAASH